MHRSAWLRRVTIFGFLVALLSGAPGQAQGTSHTFPETGHTVGGIFWQYWQAHGGLAQQGYPISEELQEKSDLNGQTYTVQYFERAVFEQHPENAPPYNVLLSQLGTFRYQAKYGAAGAPGQHASTTTPRVFPETHHTVGGVFRAYWEAHGGLAQQGFPISDEFTEVSDLNQQPYTVQYFERAVFELHPENQAPYTVLLSQLGTFQHRQKYPATGPTPTTPAGPALAGGPVPPQNSYQGCPSTGDGGDPQLNIRKNRIDTAAWAPVPLATLISLPYPSSVARQNRANWSAGDAAIVARFEGSPVQVEGYFAGAKVEGPESPNCHSAGDVDSHLWLVDDPAKLRDLSLVTEITPRTRALHPGWDFHNVSSLVSGHTRVRISGWLMLDQEHPEQLQQTRATLWEVHPILQIEAQQGGAWVPLDQLAGGAGPPPTVPPGAAPTNTAPVATDTPGAGPTPPSVGSYTATAGVSNASPTRNSRVTVSGQLLRGGQPVAGATMNSTWHYKTTDSTCSGVAGADGRAACSRDIGFASLGYTVVIDVVFQDMSGTTLATTSTSFTPH